MRMRFILEKELAAAKTKEALFKLADVDIDFEDDRSWFRGFMCERILALGGQIQELAEHYQMDRETWYSYHRVFKRFITLKKHVSKKQYALLKILLNFDLNLATSKDLLIESEENNWTARQFQEILLERYN